MPEFARAPDAISERPRIRLMGHPHVRYVLATVALAATYYGAAQFGCALDFAGPVAAILWLPAGVGIAFLYLGAWFGALSLVLCDVIASDEVPTVWRT